MEVKSTSRVAFPVPLEGTVHHAELQETLQFELEVIEKVVVPAEADTFRFVGATDNVGVAPAAVKEATMPIAACGVQT